MITMKQEYSTNLPIVRAKQKTKRSRSDVTRRWAEIERNCGYYGSSTVTNKRDKANGTV